MPTLLIASVLAAVVVIATSWWALCQPKVTEVFIKIRVALYVGHLRRMVKRRKAKIDRIVTQALRENQAASVNMARKS